MLQIFDKWWELGVGVVLEGFARWKHFDLVWIYLIEKL